MNITFFTYEKDITAEAPRQSQSKSRFIFSDIVAK